MVDTDPGPKPHNCDVKSDLQLNGPGSKAAELGVVPSLKKSKDPEKGSNSEKADFERAIELTGYGRFHYLLLAVCGLVSTSEEMDVISMSFILPSAQCDLNLTTHTKPTYGTPVEVGYSQLRVYNGYNCNFTLITLDGNNNATGENHLGPLSMYEHLTVDVAKFENLPYLINGTDGDCDGIAYTGTFRLTEKTANSFFIHDKGVVNFTDNNDKPIDRVRIRFLVNSEQNTEVLLMDSKMRVKLSTNSSDNRQFNTTRGSVDVLINGQKVLSELVLQTGAVYTVNAYNDTNGVFTANVVTITPANSVHILWLVPQYVLITMGEVMFSVTGLEFSFTQAPASMKSVLQSVWLLTVAFGNLLVVLIVEGNFLDAQWKEFFLFSGLMLVDMLIFMAMAFRYKYVELRSSEPDLAVEEIKLPEKHFLESKSS